MARFSYKAKAPNGDLTNGAIDATSLADARVKLRSQNLEPISLLAAVAPAAKGPPPATMFSDMFTARVSSKDMQIFTRQFATLINAGIPVVDSLKILSEGLRPGPLKEASAKVKFSIEGGRRLSDSMAAIPLVFDKLYCNMIQAGEEAGILDTILNRLAIYMEKSEKTKGQVKGALIYPAVIVTVAMLVIAGILIFIIPKFQEFFASAGKAPPALTMLVVALSDSLQKKWYFYLGGAIGLPMLISQWIKTPDGKVTFDKLAIKAPIFGEVVQKSAVARLTRTLSTLLASGVGLIEAIDISAKTSGNAVIEDALMQCKKSVTQGRTFAYPLARQKAIPEMVVQMIGIGEHSGTLDTMLGKIADFYEDEVETAVKTMTSLIEPLLMVVLGGIIAVLVIAMYLPIFQMGDVVGQ
jgi:type IV pilus assembly protein PilC